MDGIARAMNPELVVGVLEAIADVVGGVASDEEALTRDARALRCARRLGREQFCDDSAEGCVRNFARQGKGIDLWSFDVQGGNGLKGPRPQPAHHPGG